MGHVRGHVLQALPPRRHRQVFAAVGAVAVPLTHARHLDHRLDAEGLAVCVGGEGCVCARARTDAGPHLAGASERNTVREASPTFGFFILGWSTPRFFLSLSRLRRALGPAWGALCTFSLAFSIAPTRPSAVQGCLLLL